MLYFISIFTGTASAARTLAAIIATNIHSENHKHKMKKIGIITAIIFVLSMILITVFRLAFAPRYDKAEIKQNLGGILLCKSIESSDYHGSNIKVTYKWFYKGYTIDIGKGIFNNREWKKDEQIVKFNDWHILKTGGNINTDKIFVGRLDKRKWDEYILTPEDIEKQDIWKSEEICSFSGNKSHVIIDSIINGQIVANYNYKSSSTLNEYEQKTIIFEIDNQTGRPKMTKIN